MATAHVAGYISYLLGFDSTLSPRTFTPSLLDLTIKAQSLGDVLSGIRKFTNGSMFISVTRNSPFLHSGRNHRRFAPQRFLTTVLLSGSRHH